MWYTFQLINFDDGPDFISEGVGKVVLFLKNPNKPFEDVGERLGGLAKSGLDIADDVLKVNVFKVQCTIVHSICELNRTVNIFVL